MAATIFSSIALVWCHAGAVQFWRLCDFPDAVIPEWLIKEYKRQRARAPRLRRALFDNFVAGESYLDTRPIRKRLFPEMDEALAFWRAVREVAEQVDHERSYPRPLVEVQEYQQSFSVVPVIPLSIGAYTRPRPGAMLRLGRG
ncbi:hypothetical protein IU450_33950 [Nocardia abscessus]|uniref:hypothetical protein n=1 Tax=Nocardia abscessus TaxID=120957 RepID=UPI0018939AAE|nr:hypothetical protein [Nocardia abscessus]